MDTFLIAVMVLVCLLLLLVACNRYLPKWFCDHMSWHLEPKEIRFDGCSLYGNCPRCGREVLQDSHGSWF